MNRLLVWTIILGSGFLLGGGCVVSVVGHMDTEANLRVAIQQKSKANEASLDTMWKIIKQKANISEKAVVDLKEIYKEISEPRKGGTLFKMVTEAYPDPEKATQVYLDLMGSVEAERKTFKRDQEVLVDIVGQRQQMIERVYSGTILNIFGRGTKFLPKGDPATPATHPIDYQYVFVTSATTKEMTEKGEENEIELFDAKRANVDSED